MRVRTSPGHRAAGGFFIALFVIAVAVTMPNAASARSELGDGCDPDVPVVCVPLPDQEGLTGPSTQIAPPLPPGAPCTPINVQAATPGAQIATPLPPGCPAPPLVTRLNRANVLWAQAVRTLDTSALSQAWASPALDSVVAYVDQLRAANQYVAPELREITLTSLWIDGNRARTTTLETWYQELRWSSGEVITRDLSRVHNVYEFERFNDGWKVVRNEVHLAGEVPPVDLPTPVPPTPPRQPCIAIFPPPPGCEIPGASVTVTTDREVYTPGQPVVVTVTNTGNTPLAGGGGYACGLVEIGYAPDGGDWYVPAPGSAEVCPAIALILQPGESRTETFTFQQLGQYRATARLSVEGSRNGQVVVASDPFTVAVF